MGAPGVRVTADRDVHVVQEDGAWVTIGRIEANRELIAKPLRWGDHVAFASRGEVIIIGQRPFAVKASGNDMLPPVVHGEQLVVAEVAGRVRYYAP